MSETAETWTVTVEIPESVSIEEAGETYELSVGEDEAILDAARAAGLWLPADCRQGWCTTCAAELVSGEVDQSAARRYYESDRDAGFVLTCTAKPRSDVTVRVGQYEALLEQRADNDQPPGRSKLNR